MKYRIAIKQWRPALLNELLHNPHKAHRLKWEDARLIWAYCHQAGVPEATGPRRVRLTIAQPRGRWPDPDGVWKSLLDGLVRASRLVDDSQQFCRCEPVEFRRGPQETVIELEDL